MEYRPYSSGVISLARIMVPRAMIMVDVARPMKSCTLPFAEVLLISTIFCSIGFPLFGVVGKAVRDVVCFGNV